MTFRPTREAPPPPGARTFRLELAAFRTESERAYSERVMQILLDALTAIDVEYLKAHPRTPPLYKSGVVYTREAGGSDERWQDIWTCLQRKRADCEDLASWRAAEYRLRGVAARAFPTGRRMPGGGMMYHIRVLLPDGQIEDPSRILGMNTPDEGEPMAWQDRRLPKLDAPKAFQPAGEEDVRVPRHAVVGVGVDEDLVGYGLGEVVAQQAASMGDEVGYSPGQVAAQQAASMGAEAADEADAEDIDPLGELGYAAGLAARVCVPMQVSIEDVVTVVDETEGKPEFDLNEALPWSR